MKNRSIILIILTFTLLLLVSCGKAEKSGPEASADAFLQGIKQGDTEAIGKVYAGEDFDLDGSFASIEALAGSVEGGQEAMDTLLTKLQDFDYKITGSEIDGDKATVDVEITTYDFGGMMTDFLTDYLIESSTMTLKGESSEEMKKAAVKMFTEALDSLTEKDRKGEAALHLTKTGDTWKVDALAPDSDFLNVLSGGLSQSVLDLSEMID